MSFSDDSFGDDDDDDFLALTMKPRAPTVDPTQHRSQSPHQTQTSPNHEILAAKGEIAVLRAKLTELEQAKKQKHELLLKETAHEKTEKEAKIRALEDLARRLEDEKKFLSVEVRNLNTHKRRKRASDDHQKHIEESSESATPEPITPMPRTAAAAPSTAASTTVPLRRPENAAPVKINPPVQTDDNSQFIDSVENYTIPGTTRTTMDFLSKIALNEPFQFDSFTIPASEPIATHLLQFLIKQRRVNRLDEYITKFTKLLALLIKKLLTSTKPPEKFPVPFLIALLHCTVTFRPSALIKEVTRELIYLCHDIYKLHDHLLKPEEDVSEHIQRHRRVDITAIQYEFTDHLTLVYTCDLMESLTMTASDDGLFLKEVLAIVNEDGDFQRSVKLAFSASSNMLIMTPMLSILSSCLNAFDNEETFPLISQEIVGALMHVLLEGTTWRQNWLFSGLNVMVGNTLDNAHIEKLVGHEVKSFPTAIHPLEIKDKPKVENKHQFHLISLQLNILCLFEKLIITTTNGIALFTGDVLLLKSFVFAIGKQQELIFATPRNNLTHLRSKLVSSMVRTLHLIWEMSTIDTETSSPALTKDTTHELLIALARIAFSNNETSQDALALLTVIRANDLKSPVFNRWAEERAKQVSHASDGDVSKLVQAQSGFSNGMEFAYDDDVVELARDILEKCTTMDEADALYLSMNSGDGQRRQDDEDLLMDMT